MAEKKTEPRSLAELAGGMGKKLETIEGKQVIVQAIAFETREVRALNADAEAGVEVGDLVEKAVVFITLDDEQQYYSFSEPLIDKLKRISADDLPAFGVFTRADIGGGKRAWTIM